MGPRRVRIAAIAGLLAMTSAPSTSEAGAERRAASQDPFSPKNLARTVDAVVPAIERAAGRRFLTPPVVALADVEQLRTMLRDEEALISASVLRDTPADRRAQLVEEHSRALDTRGLLGKYGLLQKELLLVRDSIVDVLAEADPATRPPLEDVVEVIVVHELTHALHDQHSDLTRITRGLTDQDSLLAAASTWEGLATWVAERVAVDRGDTEAYVFLAGLQGWSPQGLLRTDAYPVWATYGRGRDAIAWHFNHGGFDEVWTVATSPPASTGGVFRPETWSPTRAPTALDYAGLLRGAEHVLTNTDWDVAISTVGEFDLRGEAIGGDTEATIDTMMAHLGQAWQLSGTRPDRTCAVRILEFDGPEWAQRYLDALRTQETEDTAEVATQIGREMEVAYVPFEVPGDTSVLRTARVAGADGTFTETHAAWVVRGATAVVVTTRGYRPGLRLPWAVAGVFARLDAARSGAPIPAWEDRR